MEYSSTIVRYKDLMLGLNETIHLLAMDNSVFWYGHVLVIS